MGIVHGGHVPHGVSDFSLESTLVPRPIHRRGHAGYIFRRAVSQSRNMASVGKPHNPWKMVANSKKMNSSSLSAMPSLNESILTVWLNLD